MREQKASRPLSVLLAEDTRANQKVITAILRKRGHRVTIAANGREAVEQVARAAFDAIVMDVQMPLMDGYQAAAAIRERERHSGNHTPIIALTAHSTDRDREACYQAGMDACLSKPIDVGQLVALVEKATQPRKLPTAVESPQGTLDTSSNETAIDLPTTMKRLGGDEELLKEFIEVFNEDAPGLLQALRSAIPEGDYASAVRAAHSLRGLAANFSATSVVEAASLIEHAAKSGDLTDADALLERLSSAVSQLRASLDRIKNA